MAHIGKRHSRPGSGGTTASIKALVLWTWKMRVWTNRLGLAKRRKRAVKQGNLTALTFRRRGAYFHRKAAGGASLGARSDRSLLGHAHAAGKILADPMGHERTGEAHH